ncbi:hypothetical protein TrLO_g364 [Triparma laevis f. longispina]|uniref:RGS domain-containing protein n=1 Tax=Triparma laevis f. longispina TaxID=1714387 RepID=A0A9W7CGT6_9STRA|nr:hypothetical protein TrLO_g364 [Triparma laevis f. longispina]
MANGAPPGVGHRQGVGQLFMFLIIFFPMASLIFYFVRRDEHPIKRSGRPKVAFLLMYGGLLCSIPVCIVEGFGWAEVSCFVYKLCNVCYPPLFITPILVYAIQHFKESRIHAKMASHAASNSLSPKRSKESFSHLVSSLKAERGHLRRNSFLMYCFIVSTYSAMVIFLIANEDDLDLQDSADETCRLPKGLSYCNLVFGCVSMLAMLLVVIYSHKQRLQDDFGINKEYKIAVLFSTISFPIYGCFTFMPFLEDTSSNQSGVPDLAAKYIDPSFIFITDMLFIMGIMVLWPAIRTFKNKNGSATITRLSVEHTDLHEVLNSNLYFIFVEHLKSEFSVENCMFWKHVEELRQDYGGGSEAAMEDGEGGHTKSERGGKKSERGKVGGLIRTASMSKRNKDYSSSQDAQIPIDAALDIYQMYVAQGAPMEVNISANLRGKIESQLGIKVSKGGGSMNDIMLGGDAEHVDLDIFDDAQGEIFRLMESDSLPRFKHGKLFQTYVEAMTADKSKRNVANSHPPTKISERDEGAGSGSERNAGPAQHSAGMALAKNAQKASHRTNKAKERPGKGKDKRISSDNNNLLANSNVGDNQL